MCGEGRGRYCRQRCTTSRGTRKGGDLLRFVRVVARCQAVRRVDVRVNLVLDVTGMIEEISHLKPLSRIVCLAEKTKLAREG